jgi:hypothetical protein
MYLILYSYQEGKTQVHAEFIKKLLFITKIIINL